MSNIPYKSRVKSDRIFLAWAILILAILLTVFGCKEKQTRYIEEHEFEYDNSMQHSDDCPNLSHFRTELNKEE